MTVMIKPQRSTYVTIAFTAIALLPSTGLAKHKPITPTDLLETILPGEPWDRGVFSSTKMVNFNKTSGDATTISKITLSYFTSADCSGTGAGTNPGSTPLPSYTTPDGTTFRISTGTPFGLVAASAWNVGSTKLSIADMTTIQSVGVTFKSTNSNTPQANFSGLSYACIPITCTAGPSGECTSGSGTQSFTLKTTAAVGDPADGGVIGCQNTRTSFNLFDIVVTTSDQSTGQIWGVTGTTTGANSPTDGAANTTTIVAALGTGSTYAARTCNELSVKGGFTSGWFLPSGSITNSQLNCLYNHETAIANGSVAAGGAGFASTTYWSSTEASSNNAWTWFVGSVSPFSSSKSVNRSVRCSRAF